MKKNKIESIFRLPEEEEGINESFRVRLKGGLEGYFKPAGQGSKDFLIQNNFHVSQYRHELAAYKLDRLLGLNLVPVTVSREIEIWGKKWKGSFQEGVEGNFSQIEDTRSDLLILLDYLIKNCDRHEKNLLIEVLPGKKREHAIDNGLAFNSEFCRKRSQELKQKRLSPSSQVYHYLMADPPDRIPEATLKRFSEIPDSTWRRTLSDLTESEWNEFLERKNFIKERFVNPWLHARAAGSLVRQNHALAACQLVQPTLQQAIVSAARNIAAIVATQSKREDGISEVAHDDPRVPRGFADLGKMQQVGNLIWSGVPPHHLNQKDAVAFCRSLGGRLPSRQEWEAYRVAMGFPQNYNKNRFPDMNTWFWSSSEDPDNPENAYMLLGNTGAIHSDNKDSEVSVKCVLGQPTKIK